MLGRIRLVLASSHQLYVVFAIRVRTKQDLVSLDLLIVCCVTLVRTRQALVRLSPLPVHSVTREHMKQDPAPQRQCCAPYAMPEVTKLVQESHRLYSVLCVIQELIRLALE